jgi:hypothetical protein
MLCQLSLPTSKKYNNFQLKFLLNSCSHKESISVCESKKWKLFAWVIWEASPCWRTMTRFVNQHKMSHDQYQKMLVRAECMRQRADHVAMEVGMSIGGREESQVCADLGARTQIGSRQSYYWHPYMTYMTPLLYSTES